jgi:hypothetical protein
MMANQATELQAIRYSHTFAWTHLFRAFRIAIDIRKLLLAAVALLSLAVGDRLLSKLPFSPEAATVSIWPWEGTVGTSHPIRVPGAVLVAPGYSAGRVAEYWSTVLRPVTIFVQPGLILIQQDNSWSTVAWAWTRLFWALAVWAVFGGAIVRMAAVEFALDRRIRVRAALEFALSKFLAFFTAPLLPVVGIGFFWSLGLLGGLVGWIPGVGEPIVGVFWFFALLFGFVMALILIGLTVGWPLMHATIGTEATDSFDGFQRSFSYVFGKPWHYLFYVLIAVVYGMAVVFFVDLVTSLTVHLAGRSVASGLGQNATDVMIQSGPSLVGGSDLLQSRVVDDVSLGSRLAGGWLHVVAAILTGFVYSYFWTATTIIYFLLRKADDATELDEVFLADEPEPDDLLPLVTSDETPPVTIDDSTPETTSNPDTSSAP